MTPGKGSEPWLSRLVAEREAGQAWIQATLPHLLPETGGSGLASLSSVPPGPCWREGEVDRGLWGSGGPLCQLHLLTRDLGQVASPLCALFAVCSFSDWRRESLPGRRGSYGAW